MRPELLSELITMVGAFGAGAVIAVSITYAFLKSYLFKYVEERAKNRAALEDAAAIERVVQRVKSEFSAKERLRFAALDRRLQAHQEAYGLSRELLKSCQSGDGGRMADAIAETANWFNKNALYLEPESRQALWSCQFAVSDYRRCQSGTEEEQNKNWENIVTAQEIIANCVGLPVLLEDRDET